MSSILTGRELLVIWKFSTIQRRKSRSSITIPLIPLLLGLCVNGGTIKFEVTRLQSLEDLHRVIFLGNLLQLVQVLSAIGSEWVLELAGVVHVDELHVEAHGLGLFLETGLEFVHVRLDHGIVSRVGPHGCSLADGDGAISSIKWERIAAVVGHVRHHGLGDGLGDHDAVEVLDASDLGDFLEEDFRHSLQMIAVDLECDVGEHLAETKGVRVFIEFGRVFMQTPNLSRVHDGGQALVAVENWGVGDGIGRPHLSIGKFHAVPVSPCNPLADRGVRGSISDPVGICVIDLLKRLLHVETSSSPDQATGERDQLGLKLDDDAKVVSSSTQSPEQVRVLSRGNFNDQAGCSDDLCEG